MTMYEIFRDWRCPRDAHCKQKITLCKVKYTFCMAIVLAGCAPAPAPPDGRLLIDGGTVVVMDAPGTILDGGGVLVEGDRIAALLAPDDPRPTGVRVIDATGHLVIPGLVNTHGHAAMSLLRGLADDLPLLTWLEDYIFPAEAALVAPDFVYWGTLLSSVEMLKGGRRPSRTCTTSGMTWRAQRSTRASGRSPART